MSQCFRRLWVKLGITALAAYTPLCYAQKLHENESEALAREKMAVHGQVEQETSDVDEEVTNPAVFLGKANSQEPLLEDNNFPDKEIIPVSSSPTISGMMGFKPALSDIELGMVPTVSDLNAGPLFLQNASDQKSVSAYSHFMTLPNIGVFNILEAKKKQDSEPSGFWQWLISLWNTSEKSDLP